MLHEFGLLCLNLISFPGLWSIKNTLTDSGVYSPVFPSLLPNIHHCVLGCWSAALQVWFEDLGVPRTLSGDLPYPSYICVSLWWWVFLINWTKQHTTNSLRAAADTRTQLPSVKPHIKEICKKNVKLCHLKFLVLEDRIFFISNVLFTCKGFVIAGELIDNNVKLSEV